MSRDEFIGKLQMVYVGDRNALDEIVGVYDNLKGALQTHEILLKTNVEENQRLNNVLNELEKWLKVNLIDLEKQNASNIYNEGLKRGMIANGRLIQNKLKELKESDK